MGSVWVKEIYNIPDIPCMIFYLISFWVDRSLNLRNRKSWRHCTYIYYWYMDDFSSSIFFCNLAEPFFLTVRRTKSSFALEDSTLSSRAEGWINVRKTECPWLKRETRILSRKKNSCENSHGSRHSYSSEKRFLAVKTKSVNQSWFTDYVKPPSQPKSHTGIRFDSKVIGKL